MENEEEMVLVADRFIQREYTDPQTGIILPYNLFVPTNYDAHKAYPMVLFIHDAGVNSSDPKTTLVQGSGATIWATTSEQAKHECFVLAPQFSKIIVNDESEATPELDVMIHLVKSVSDQYSIDKNRMYTTGQSMGCMSSIEMMIRCPDLFAGALLVAGQWNAGKMSVLTSANIWIVVAEGDTKAFPGMNASMAALEGKGAKISRATWSGLASDAEFKAETDRMTADNCTIKYCELKKGTVVPDGQPDHGGSNHVNTWRIAYTIEGLRDWLFAQKKPENNPNNAS